MNAVDFDAGFRGVRKSNRFGFTVARIIPSGKKFHADAMLGVTKMFTSSKRRNIAQTFQMLVNYLQAFRSYENVHVFRKAPITVKEKGQSADHRIGNAKVIKAFGDFTQ